MGAGREREEEEEDNDDDKVRERGGGVCVCVWWSVWLSQGNGSRTFPSLHTYIQTYRHTHTQIPRGTYEKQQCLFSRRWVSSGGELKRVCDCPCGDGAVRCIADGDGEVPHKPDDLKRE